MAKQSIDLGGGFKAQVEPRDGGTWIGLSGSISEAVNFAPLTTLPGPLRFDLADVQRINSLGVRGWTQFVQKLERAGLDVTFERCSPVVVTQISMISNFMGARSRTVSLFAPYLCSACGKEHLELVAVTPGAGVTVAPTLPCPKCKGAMQLDELEALFESLFKTR